MSVKLKVPGVYLLCTEPLRTREAMTETEPEGLWGHPVLTILGEGKGSIKIRAVQWPSNFDSSLLSMCKPHPCSDSFLLRICKPACAVSPVHVLVAPLGDDPWLEGSPPYRARDRGSLAAQDMCSVGALPGLALPKSLQRGDLS